MRFVSRGLTGSRTARIAQPAVVVLAACLVFVIARYAAYQDWMAFVDYDGYYSYFIARWGFDVGKVAPLIESTTVAYRYQRILYPLAAYLLSLGGHATLSAFFLVFLNVASITVGTYVVALILDDMNVNPWYALAYGLYGGQILELMTSLSEPLSFCLVALGIYFWTRDRLPQSVVAFALAALAKEVALLFVLAIAASYVLERQWKRAMLVSMAALPFALWQFVLSLWLGDSGVMSSFPFEPPLWGWLSGIFEAPEAFLLSAIVLIPMSYAPMLILGAKATVDLLKKRSFHPYVLMIVAHVAFMLLLPKLTAREPSAMIRITQGLVLSTLLYGGLIRSSRILNYSLLWIATLAVVVRGSGRTDIPHF